MRTGADGQYRQQWRDAVVPARTNGVNAHRRRAIAVAALLAAVLAPGCAGPHVRARVEPPDATMLVDGVAVPPQRRGELPFAYYGTRVLTGVPGEPPPPPASLRQPVRQEAGVRPPAPEWLFPLDFFADAIGWFWRSDRAASVELRLPLAGPEGQAGVEPAGADALRARASAMRTER